MGTALSASTIAGIMQGCKADPELVWTPTFFNDQDAKFVSLMADTIIPPTDTAGARQAGVPKFIEEMVSLVYSEDEQEAFTDHLTACRKHCNDKYGDEFIYLKEETQLEYVQALDKLAKAVKLEKKSPKDITPEVADFFWRMKELTVTGYFTTEVGATEVLQYKQIPVEYHGCISLEEAGGKTWATT